VVFEGMIVEELLRGLILKSYNMAVNRIPAIRYCNVLSLTLKQSPYWFKYPRVGYIEKQNKK
jgi:hypothetical protein